MLRKTIKNIALLDLRNFTAEALREIKKIESCAMLLIPKNASDEWKNAYAKITIRNVASIIEVSYSKYSVLNGMVTAFVACGAISSTSIIPDSTTSPLAITSQFNL